MAFAIISGSSDVMKPPSPELITLSDCVEYAETAAWYPIWRPFHLTPHEWAQSSTRVRPCFSQISTTRSMWAILPRMCDSTSTFAFGCAAAFFSRSSRSIVQLGVASTRTGSAPRRMIVDGSAVKVRPFVITSSPLSTPHTIIAIMIADEYEFTPSAYFWPTISANSTSACETCDVSAGCV